MNIKLHLYGITWMNLSTIIKVVLIELKKICTDYSGPATG